ncbi:MAG TPA: marine proteobacterial sortase target protein [Campylobacterales bacterium]|nr:marine proteobacterial sortase target protein [Campylobacterales bacterium]
MKVLKICLMMVLLFSYVKAQSEVAEMEFYAKGDKPVDAFLLNNKAHIEIFALNARVTIKQTYENKSNEWVEGRYLLPLPENGAVDSLLIKTKDGITKGVIKEKEEAKKVYAEAKKAGKKTSLVEMERPNLFTTKVANIAPNSSIIVEVSYTQPITYKLGAFSLMLPNTLTPRYTPPTQTKEEESLSKVEHISANGWANSNGITPSFKRTKVQNSHNIEITASIKKSYMINKIQSSSHAIEWKEDADKYVVALKSVSTAMNKDFHLSWTAIAAQKPRAALLKESIDNEEYLTLMVMPPQRVQDALILAREMIFVIDTSGSMAGVSMTQAKASLTKALSLLSAKDKFNIIEFDTNFTNLYSQSKAVTKEHIRQANNFIAKMSADGGTNIKPALNKALEQSSEDGYLKQIIFLTDGSVGNEEELFKHIKAKLTDERLFTIAIGTAPNVYFMRQAAKYGRGVFTHINNTQMINKQISDLFYQIKNPVLRDVKISFENNQEIEYFPKNIPDLYLGEPLMVYIKTKNKENGKIIINGKLLDEEWNREIQYSSLAPSKGIAKLWAKKKIEHLMDQKIVGVKESTIKKQVTPLALQYGLMSKYTSFVAVEEKVSRPQEEVLTQKQVPNLIPEGNTMLNKPVVQRNSNMSYPSTATNKELYFIIGLLFLVLSFLALGKEKYANKIL